MNNFIKQHGLFFLFLLIGIFFRFYNLNWGSPFYFHPDERQNVVYPILSSHSLFLLDQQNFDTGTFPLIFIKLIYTLFTNLFHVYDQFQTVLLISRTISSFISVGILVALFFIGKKIFGVHKSYISVTLAIFSTGFIQFSHFGTIELWEAAFFLLLFFYAWRIAKYARLADTVIAGFLLGFAISTKILSLILVPAIIFSFFLFLYRQHVSKNNVLKNLKKILIALFLFLLSCVFAFIVSSLPLITNYNSAHSSIRFESAVALGKEPVFYTQSFRSTLPILFQFTRVYPFLLNPLITILFLLSIIYVFIFGIIKKNYSYLLVCIFYLLLFIFQSFFFVKWTRYMIPTLPFIYLITGIAIDDVLNMLKQRTKNISVFSYALITLPVVISFIFAASFIVVAYFQTSTSIAASNFAKLHIPQNASIISESFDPNSAVFNEYFPNISYLNFYNLENESYNLTRLLPYTDYIILPSQRLLMTRLHNKKNFPTGNKFYEQLINGQLGFENIYETPCDVFCRITYLDDPVFSFEETASVFDRPTVFIFKKTRTFDENIYQALLK